MINAELHRQPVAVDRDLHRSLRLAMPVADWSIAAQLNAVFVTAVEFGDAARDFPIVFVQAADEDDPAAVAPIAVLALNRNDNLYVDGPRWRGQYVPAVLGSYPFGTSRIDADRFAICLDAAWSGVSQGGGSAGEALFGDDGRQTPFMDAMQAQLEQLEGHIQRTRQMCARLRDLQLLKPMRFDATLPSGAQLSVDGFLTVDDTALGTLSDATVLELHRTGLLGLVHAHFVSLGNMRKLLQWHVEKFAPAAPGLA